MDAADSLVPLAARFSRHHRRKLAVALAVQVAILVGAAAAALALGHSGAWLGAGLIAVLMGAGIAINIARRRLADRLFARLFAAPHELVWLHADPGIVELGLRGGDRIRLAVPAGWPDEMVEATSRSAAAPVTTSGAESYRAQSARFENEAKLAAVEAALSRRDSALSQAIETRAVDWMHRWRAVRSAASPELVSTVEEQLTELTVLLEAARRYDSDLGRVARRNLRGEGPMFGAEATACLERLDAALAAAPR